LAVAPFAPKVLAGYVSESRIQKSGPVVSSASNSQPFIFPSKVYDVTEGNSKYLH